MTPGQISRPRCKSTLAGMGKAQESNKLKREASLHFFFFFATYVQELVESIETK